MSEFAATEEESVYGNIHTVISRGKVRKLTDEDVYEALELVRDYGALMRERGIEEVQR